MATRASKSYICAGSSTFDDPDVVEVSPAAAAGWAAPSHHKRKRSQVVPQEVIEIDDDDPVIIIGDKAPVDKNKQTAVCPMNWQKHSKSGWIQDTPGASTYVSKHTNSWVDHKVFQDEAGYKYPASKHTNSWFDHKAFQDEAVYNDPDDYPNEGYEEDYAYDEDEFEDDGYDDASLIESEFTFGLPAKFDNLGVPHGLEASLPWMQKPAIEIGNKTKPTKAVVDKIEEKYKAFKRFDTVDDHSDHYYSKPETRKVQVVKKPSKDWVKRIQHEWKVLEKDLPDSIFVRAYEDRMDLLRAVIMGPAGTPYHDGLFFFDIYFPPQYPHVPPMVNYRAGGLRLNPNLYACGKVCLSLLNTWTGSGCEKWNPANSTMLQVLVSIQALVLNAKPYFNEPGYAPHANTAHGEKKSLTYNEDTFLLSCRTMLYSLRNPPKNFEDFVAGHFRKYGRNILVACRAYLDGAQVGCLSGDGVQDVDEGDKSCSVRFKQSLKRLHEELLMEFTAKGADCDKFLTEKARSGASTSAADTTLRL